MIYTNCQHDDSEWWCGACGKPAMYENLCGNCGPIMDKRCLDCDAIIHSDGTVEE